MARQVAIPYSFLLSFFVLTTVILLVVVIIISVHKNKKEEMHPPPNRTLASSSSQIELPNIPATITSTKTPNTPKIDLPSL